MHDLSKGYIGCLYLFNEMCSILSKFLFILRFMPSIVYTSCLSFQLSVACQT